MAGHHPSDSAASAKTNRVEYLQSEVNEALEQFCIELKNSPAELYEPIRYMLKIGGKRMRPVLLLMSCEMFSGERSKAMQAALAMELFHNFTLMHDDIMDNAPFRRTFETVHKKWNRDIAILSGDALFVESYKCIAKAEPETLSAILDLFSRTALEVCEGQQLDMNFETENALTISQYIEMITLKTAVLLGCCMQSGAIIAHASADNQQLSYDFGKNLGISFQLKDDMLDVYGDHEKFGKQVGGDILSNKKTFLLLKAMEDADDSRKKELSRWLSLREFDAAEKVSAVKNIFDSLDIRTKTMTEMNRYFELAMSCLEKISVEPESKRALKELAGNLLVREK